MESMKACSDDNLVEVATKNWRELRDVFASNWPKNHIAWHTVNNYLNWFRIEPRIRIMKIYSLNGTWRSDGTIVVIDSYQLFVYSLDLSNEKLKRLLRLLDWSHGYLVSTLLKRHRSTVLEIVKEKKLNIANDALTYLFYLPKEEAKRKSFLAPSNIILKPLSSGDAEIVFTENNCQQIGSHLCVKRLIEWNPNLGAWDRNGELLGWCLRLQSGALGGLQVREKFKRRGVGSLVVIAMVKILVSMQMDSFAFVNSNDELSQRIFTKMGFRKTDDIYWLKTTASMMNGNGLKLLSNHTNGNNYM